MSPEINKERNPTTTSSASSPENFPSVSFNRQETGDIQEIFSLVSIVSISGEYVLDNSSTDVETSDILSIHTIQTLSLYLIDTSETETLTHNSNVQFPDRRWSALLFSTPKATVIFWIAIIVIISSSSLAETHSSLLDEKWIHCVVHQSSRHQFLLRNRLVYRLVSLKWIRNERFDVLLTM